MDLEDSDYEDATWSMESDLDDADADDATPTDTARPPFRPLWRFPLARRLPYAQCIETEAADNLRVVKHALARAYLLRDATRLLVSLGRLDDYLVLYGSFMPREDYLLLIQLLIKCVLRSPTDYRNIERCCHTARRLLKYAYRYIDRNDLEIDWKPLYQLYRSLDHHPFRQTKYSHCNRSTLKSLKNLIRVCRIFFPVSATAEILDLLLPELCPLDTATNTVLEMIEVFLPVELPPALHEHGWRLWLSKLLDLIALMTNAAPWDHSWYLLMGRLGWFNVGYVVWPDRVRAAVFSRLLRSFGLPTGFSRASVYPANKTNVLPLTLWAVSMLGGIESAMDYLERLLEAISSYFYASNSGPWQDVLGLFLFILCRSFTIRVHRERHRRSLWTLNTLESHRLSDADIERFVRAVLPCSMQGVYWSSTRTKEKVLQSLGYLSNLRAELVVDPIIESLYMSVDTVTEPHRLTCTILALSCVLRPAVLLGRSHLLLPLLEQLIPAIDVNDEVKSSCFLHLMARFADVASFVDCSQCSDNTDMSQEQREACALTASSESLLLQLLDRLLALVESLSVETVRHAQLVAPAGLGELRGPGGGTFYGQLQVVEVMLLEALSKLASRALLKTDPDTQRLMAGRLQRFIMSCASLDGRLSGRMAAALCSAVVAANSGLGLELLIVPVIDTILQIAQEVEEEHQDTGNQERCDDNPDRRLMFHLLLLKQMTEMCDGQHLLAISARLECVLRRCCHLPQRAVTDLSSDLLSALLRSLLAAYITDYGDWPDRIADTHARHLLVKEWGQCSNCRLLRVRWHVCSEKELSWATELVQEFVLQELDGIEQYLNNGKQLNKEELLCSLRLVLGGLNGAAVSVPPIESPLSSTIGDHGVEPVPFSVEVGCPILPLQCCLRQRIAELMSELIKYQRQHHPDDVFVFKAIIAILDTVMTNFGSRIPVSHPSRLPHHSSKNLDLYIGPRRLSEFSLAGCLMSYHSLRLSMKYSVRSSELFCDRVMPDLLALSLNDYSVVRKSAQYVLSDCTNMAFNSAEALWPRVVELLRSGQLSHEQLKGLLHVISMGRNHLIMRDSWRLKLSLWPALLLCTDSEKESIARLIQALPRGIYYYVQAPLRRQFLSCGDVLAEQLCDASPVTQQQRQTAEQELVASAAENLRLYQQLLTQLLQLYQSGKLHWRRNQLALDMVAMLVRPDVLPSAGLIQALLDGILHSSIVVRKESCSLLLAVLKQLKPSHPITSVDRIHHLPVHASLQCNLGSGAWRHWPQLGERAENRGLQYDSGTAPRSAQEWREPRFVHKMKWGYSQLPCPFTCVYLQLDEHSPEGTTPAHQAVANFLASPACLDKMLHYMSMEENKGRDTFLSSNSYLFKSLARNHGVNVLDSLLPNLQKLAAEMSESSQKCAAEIFCGLVRGSKHWPFDSVERMWLCLIPILTKCVANVHKHSSSTWISCISKCVGDRDPNRLHWLMEALLKSVFCPEDVLFVTCVKLDFLLVVCGELEWRGAEINHRVLDLLSSHLYHPYQSVRRKIGSVLAKVFSPEIYQGPFTFGPKSAQFLDIHLPKLDALLSINTTPDDVDERGSTQVDASSSPSMEMSSNSDDDQHRPAVYKLLQTLCHYMSASVAGRLTAFLSPVHVRLIPVLCAVESYDTDRDLQSDCITALHLVSSQFFDEETMAALLQQLRRVMEHPYWRVQMAALRFLQAVTFHNMFLLLKQSTLSAEITELVLAALVCARLEVRQLASQVLSGLLHCHFIGLEQRRRLVARFSSETSVRLAARGAADYSTSLLRRHSAVLGLCALVAASPYDIPEDLPSVLTTLSSYARDPPPIQDTIRTTISNFKRTHYENWSDHSRHFTSDQLCTLTDMMVSPNYYV